MIENDALVGVLLGGRITPMSQTVSSDSWNATRFYDQFRQSIWPDSSSLEDQLRYKFRGV
jgi:hypothetical protein